MPFPFVYVCDLLQELERLFTRDVPLLPGHHREELREKTSRWFRRHYRRLDEQGTDFRAVLSMFQPQNMTDRVYGVDASRLESIIARALNLTQAQYFSLQKWRSEPINGDLAVRVCQVMENMQGVSNEMKNLRVILGSHWFSVIFYARVIPTMISKPWLTWEQIPPRAQSNEVTVEQIDQALLQIAAFNKESSPEIRSLAQTWDDADYVTLLGDLYQKLQAREAKWLTRIILKDHAPLQFPETLELSASSGHSHLPRCLNVSIKLQELSASAVRRNGPGLIQGIASLSSSSSPTKPISIAPSSVRTTKLAFLLVPPTSSPAVPTAVTPSSNKRSRKRAATKSGPALSTPTSFRTISSPSFRPVLREVSTNSSQNGSQSSSANPKSGLSIVIGSGSCQLASKKCPLSTCIFILAPCITNLPWLTENLLRWHGSHFVTSLSAVRHPSLPRLCPKSGKPYRKIVLVESNRTEATVKFLKKIRKFTLKKKYHRGWVEVYDWRLLECLAKVDQGKQLSYDPWKRCWIMAI